MATGVYDVVVRLLYIEVQEMELVVERRESARDGAIQPLSRFQKKKKEKKERECERLVGAWGGTSV